MPESAWPPLGTLLAFDFGFRRIGVAVGQTATRTASPLVVVNHSQEPDWRALDGLFSEWKPCAVVVGLPLDSEGKETKLSGACRRFGARLEQRFDCPVYFADERLTSRAAESDFAARRASGRARRKDAGKLDAVAAGIILENWLQSLPP